MVCMSASVDHQVGDASADRVWPYKNSQVASGFQCDFPMWRDRAANYRPQQSYQIAIADLLRAFSARKG